MNLTRRLWWIAGAWTLAIGMGTALLIQHHLRDQRQQALDTAGHRLNSLRDTLAVTFQQWSALPRALGREDGMRRFLKSMDLPQSPLLTEADRPRTRAMLMAQPAVRLMSQNLLEITRDFSLGQILLFDRHGTSVADSNFDTELSPIGGNYKTRAYFTEALDQGVGSQFAVGRVARIPGFFFAGRIDEDDRTLGVLIIKQEPKAMARLFDDEKRPIFVTDANGVVIMGNQPEWLLKHAPLTGQMALAAPAQVRTYHAPVATLPWSLSTLGIGQTEAPLVRIGEQRYLAQSRPLMGENYTAWILTPLQSEAAIVGQRAGLGALALLLGYGLLAMIQQRDSRMSVLRKGQQELNDMAHALPLAVFRYECTAEGDGRFTFLSKVAEALLGVSVHDLQANPNLAWRMFGEHETRPPTEAVELSTQINGHTRWLRCLSTPLPQVDGGTCYNGYWLDITAEKEQITRSQEVFNSAPNAYLFFDLTLGIQRANPAAVRMFNAPSERALVGLHPWMPPISPPLQADGRSGQDTAMQTLQSAMASGQPMTLEWQHSTLDGHPFTADVVVIPFMQDGVQQFCAVVQDISLRKQTEAFMLAAQQAAEAATQAKSRFLANMSHEIRTPMNAILGMTHLALMDEMPVRARNYVDKAHRAAGNLLQILNDILDVSKIESGKLELEDTEFQLESVVSQMADVLGVRAEEKRLELLFTAEPDIPTALVGDPMRLGQVLINLGTNAIKFTAKGEVIIGCEVQQQEATSVTLHFWVKDSGIGMTREQLDRLFEPFTQADISAPRHYGGTELGLAICRQLVQLIGGLIWAESQPGSGSTLHFTARFGLQTQGHQTRRAMLAHELRHKRLLLVDDNPAAREVLGDMARRMGLDVEVADSGTTALRRMEQAAFEGKPHQLLLTDWQMPGMDGIEFARHALNLPPEHRPCVLLVTAFARDEALRAAEGVGLAGVLNKPVTPSTLLDTISRALGHGLPAIETLRSSGPSLETAQRHLAGARVLLVEDQPMNQELACDLLQRAGLSVVTANDGQEALDLLAQDLAFDGVLMDCQMPVMDGYTATQRIRADARLQHLPVIAMTASAMASDRERVLAAGMNDHITKPLDLPQMFAIMARWITPRHPTLTSDSTEPEAALPATVSLDTADGLNRCMGNLDLYRRLLKGFAKTQARVHDDLLQACQQSQWTQAYSLAHSLKGLSGNIGAKRLAEAAEALEVACKADDASTSTVQAATDHVLAHLLTVMSDIQQLTRAPAQPGQTEQRPGVDELQPWWSELQRLMQQQEAQARDVMDDLLNKLPGVRHWASVLELRDALQRYDFEEALQALARWRQQATQSP